MAPMGLRDVRALSVRTQHSLPEGVHLSALNGK